jgi:hypothetical protein
VTIAFLISLCAAVTICGGGGGGSGGGSGDDYDDEFILYIIENTLTVASSLMNRSQLLTFSS